jgi:hypothetical protein
MKNREIPQVVSIYNLVCLNGGTKQGVINMKSAHKLFLSIILLIGCLMPVTSNAGDWIKPGEERFYLRGGAFLPAFDTKLRIDNETLGIGDEIDLQNDLGFDDTQTTFYGSVYWRFFPRHRIGLGYFQFNEETSATASRDIQIGDEIFPVGASLFSEMEFRVFPIFYSFSFMKREKFEFTGTLGLHWYQIDFKVAGSASLGNLDGDAEVSAKANAPLPLIGLGFDYFFTPKWTAGIEFQAFSLDLGDLSGSLVNATINTEYWFFNNVGAGAALNWFGLDVDVEDNNWRGALEYRYWGPQVYLTVRF